MTPEQLERAQRLAAAKDELHQLMRSCPRVVIEGGATRVAAWKAAVAKAQKMLARDPKDPSKVNESVLEIKACYGPDIAALAKQVYAGG